MTQTALPYLFLRGGSSRGPYFNRADLPVDRDALGEVLMDVVGAGHPLNIDGLGGGAAVTTKVAMLSPSERADADVDYFFAQVAVEAREVDFGPTCGNILVGVGPAAIEMGLVAAGDPETRVTIAAVNTGALIEAVIQTPGRRVRYDGEAAIDSVPGTAAPVLLKFRDVAGSGTGALFPTARAKEEIGGVAVTCIDVAMPMVVARAEDFGLTGYETPEELDANAELFARLDRVRLESGRRMGLGDVTNKVTPKVGLLAPPTAGGTVAARYFMPWKCHPTMAVTGGQCLAACALAPGTVAEGLAEPPREHPVPVAIEHPTGRLEVSMEVEAGAQGFCVRSAGLVRTARLIARGEVFVPA